MLKKLSLKNFTVFDDLELDLGSGINVFIGKNGTGKTHLLKLMYAACDITSTELNFAHKLMGVFMPSNNCPGRLVRRVRGSSEASIQITRNGNLSLAAKFSNHTKNWQSVESEGQESWSKRKIESVYIPVKEMLSNAPGFRSLYEKREIRFEEVYKDIVDRAYLPVLSGPTDSERKKLLQLLEKAISGKVIQKGEEFFLKSKQGNLEFMLLAEGIRKLGLLWLLIQNGTLMRGSVLFWDEPETNLNPSLYGSLIDILLELQRNGVQIFLATHDYVILKEIDLRKKMADSVNFYSLYENDAKGKHITCSRTSNYLKIDNNAIAETFSDLYDREIERGLKGNG